LLKWRHSGQRAATQESAGEAVLAPFGEQPTQD
jgi:hypothetical protein